MRRALTACLLAACTTASLVATASPGSAAGAGSTRYDAGWTFTSGALSGGVTLASRDMSLTDYSGGTYYDRVTGSHARSGLTVRGVVCGSAAKDQTGISFYGKTKDWVQIPVGEPQFGRVNVSCMIDGLHHRFHWGNYGTADAGYDSTRTTNCVSAVRTSPTTLLLDASTCAEAQEVVYDSRLRQVGGAQFAQIPFTATITVPTLK